MSQEFKHNQFSIATELLQTEATHPKVITPDFCSSHKMASKTDHPNSDLNDLVGYLSPALYDDTMRQLRELEKLGKLEITGNKEELEEMQRVELAKAFPVPPDYPKIRTICDCDTNGGYAAKTTNRASSIFYALASLLFKSDRTNRKMANQVKLLFLKQLESDYTAAKNCDNIKDGLTYIRLIRSTLMDLHEPWTDLQWVMASKAFFCPIHVLYYCSRVPYIPHVQRYIFSPVIETENPIRILIENEDYNCDD